MYRWTDSEQTTVQRLDDGAFVPKSSVLFHLVEAWIGEGNVIGEFLPDPEAIKGAKRAAAREELLEAILTSDRPLDQVVSEARSKLARADVIGEIEIGGSKRG